MPQVFCSSARHTVPMYPPEIFSWALDSHRITTIMQQEEKDISSSGGEKGQIERIRVILFNRRSYF